MGFTVGQRLNFAQTIAEAVPPAKNDEITKVKEDFFNQSKELIKTFTRELHRRIPLTIQRPREGNVANKLNELTDTMVNFLNEEGIKKKHVFFSMYFGGLINALRTYVAALQLALEKSKGPLNRKLDDCLRMARSFVLRFGKQSNQAILRLVLNINDPKAIVNGADNYELKSINWNLESIDSKTEILANKKFLERCIDNANNPNTRIPNEKGGTDEFTRLHRGDILGCPFLKIPMPDKQCTIANDFFDILDELIKKTLLAV